MLVQSLCSCWFRVFVHVGSECLFILVLVLVTSLRHKQEGHGGPFKDQIAKRKLQRILGGKNMPPLRAPPTFCFAPLAASGANCLSARARLDEENDWVLHLKLFRSRRLAETCAMYSWFKVEMRSGKPNWVCLKIVYPYTQWLMIIIHIKWL